MQVHLKQEEIKSALRQYVAAQGIDLAGKDVEITFTAGRKQSGISADITIEDSPILVGEPDGVNVQVTPRAPALAIVPPVSATVTQVAGGIAAGAAGGTAETPKAAWPSPAEMSGKSEESKPVETPKVETGRDGRSSTEGGESQPVQLIDGPAQGHRPSRRHRRVVCPCGDHHRRNHHSRMAHGHPCCWCFRGGYHRDRMRGVLLRGATTQATNLKPTGRERQLPYHAASTVHQCLQGGAEMWMTAATQYAEHGHPTPKQR
jgi:hypothetical protein